MSPNLHEKRHTPDTLVVIDTYDWYDSTRRDDEQTDALFEAAVLTNMASTHGQRVDFETITNEKDRDRISSYKRMRHTIHSMNGNRPSELIGVIMDLVDRVNDERPDKVIVVGDNEEFHLLCSAAEQNHAQVQLWTSNPKLPLKLRRYEVHPLEIVHSSVPKTKPTVVVRLDAENHLITLHKRGSPPDARLYLEAVRKATADLGNVINIQAWADWKRLRDSLARDYQHEFEQNGVKTFYQINEPGKSTSDVAMVGSIHESLDHDNGLDTYVIGTGDADFTPVVESIRNQGKKVVVLAMEGSLGHKLRQAADEVRFLDEHFHRIPSLPPEHVDGRGSKKELVATLTVAHTLRTRRWHYVFLDRLPAWLEADWIREALKSGLLLPHRPSETNCVALNMDHPTTRQVAYFEKWVQRQLHYYLHVRKFGYVDTTFLTNRMLEDEGCRELKLGQDRSWVIALLEAGKEACQLEHQLIDHPTRMGVRIHTWALPGEPPAKEPDQPRQAAGAPTPNPAPPQEKLEPATDSLNKAAGETGTPSGQAKKEPKAF